MIAVDTSVAVPALASGHPDHLAAHAVVAAERPALPAHAAVETYAVLSRLPAPAGVPADIAAHLVTANFGTRILPGPSEPTALLAELGSLGVIGGAAYDALIAVTARAAGAMLITADRRAAETYERIGVEFQLIDNPRVRAEDIRRRP